MNGTPQGVRLGESRSCTHIPRAFRGPLPSTGAAETGPTAHRRPRRHQRSELQGAGGAGWICASRLRGTTFVPRPLDPGVTLLCFFRRNVLRADGNDSCDVLFDARETIHVLSRNADADGRTTMRWIGSMDAALVTRFPCMHDHCARCESNGSVVVPPLCHRDSDGGPLLPEESRRSVVNCCLSPTIPTSTLLSTRRTHNTGNRHIGLSW